MNNFNIVVQEVKESNFETFINLFEKYEYEMSQYELYDLSYEGLYKNNSIVKYINNKFHKAMIFYNNISPIGFTAYYHNDIKCLYSLTELFIVYKYRKCGIARKVLYNLFIGNPGMWRVEVHPKNLNALSFWLSIIKAEFVSECKILINDIRKYKDGSMPVNIFFMSDK